MRFRRSRRRQTRHDSPPVPTTPSEPPFPAVAQAVAPARAPRLAGCLSLNLLLTHLLLYALGVGFFLVVNVVTDPLNWWFQWVAWGWGMVLAIHAGAVVSPRRWLGAHVGLYLVANAGLALVSLFVDGDIWFLWPLAGWGAVLVLHAGLSVARRPPAMLDEQPSPVPAGEPGPAPVVATRPSLGMTIVSIGLGLFAFGAAVSAVAAGIEDLLVVEGSGRLDSRALELSAFDRVEVDGIGELTVRHGETYAVTVSGDDNLIDDVRVNVVNGRLRISFGNRFVAPVEPRQPLRYEVTLPSLVWLRAEGEARATVVDAGVSRERLQVRAGGQSEVRLDDLMLERLDVEVSDVAVVTSAGQVDAQSIEVDDAGTYNGRALQSRTTEVRGDDAGTMFVWAEVSLTGTVGQASVVHYSGDPTVDVAETGNGRATERDPASR